jgi:hypothetical protein
LDCAKITGYAEFVAVGVPVLLVCSSSGGGGD